MFKNDTFGIGIAIGIGIPLMLFFLSYEIMVVSGKLISAKLIENLQLFIIGINGLVLRQFLVKREQDRIGRGILLATLGYAILYFCFYYTNLFT